MSQNLKLDITTVVDNYLCHSCGACFASCGHDSIAFNESIGGYISPNINYDTCTNCGICYDVCSGVNYSDKLQQENEVKQFQGPIFNTYVGRTLDKNIYNNSQSGGLMTQLIKSLFDKNEIEVALVAIMREGESPRGEFELISDSSQLYKSQKSKYTPIPLLHAIPLLKKVHGKIAIVGLSCHFHSLQNLIEKHSWLSKKEIIKLGLICDRVMVSSAIDFLALKSKMQNVTNITFRDKLKPKYPGNTVIYSQSEEIILDKSIRKNMKDFFTPVRCHLCFDKLNITSDITMGDPHGIKSIEENNGETLAICRTEQSKKYFNLMKNNINFRKVNTQIAIKGQKIDKKIESFYKFTSAWESLGKELPKYPFKIKKVTNFNIELKKLKHSLSLDDNSSRELLIEKANRYYRFSKAREYISIPKKLIAKIINKFRKL